MKKHSSASPSGHASPRAKTFTHRDAKPGRTDHCCCCSEHEHGSHRTADPAHSHPHFHSGEDGAHEDAPITFAGLLAMRVPELDPGMPEALAGLDYRDELRLKQSALQEFWRKKHLPGTPDPVIAAPVPRGSRSVSKRRAIYQRNGKLALSLGYGKVRPIRSGAGDSLLEPAMHNEIYEAVEMLLNQPPFIPLAKVMNYVILRGSAEHCAMILNISAANGTVVRKAKQLVEDLREADPRLNAAYLYLDESRSDFYLEVQRPDRAVTFKKLFGSEFLELRIQDRKFLYPPTVFAQNNEAMLPLFVKTAFELLKPRSDTPLIDLYCGFGLFGLMAADRVSSVTGMEIQGPAVEAARANAKYHFPGKDLRFISSSVTGNSVAHKLHPPERRELIVLDPPRHGTLPGVIESVVARKPLRILHIFCGTDTIPKELKHWAANGYYPRRIVPLDLFPGSLNLETLVLLEHDLRLEKPKPKTDFRQTKKPVRPFRKPSARPAR